MHIAVASGPSHTQRLDINNPLTIGDGSPSGLHPPRPYTRYLPNKPAGQKTAAYEQGTGAKQEWQHAAITIGLR
jgi:hypothetical protein